jgi:hypothetical protein
MVLSHMLTLLRDFPSLSDVLRCRCQPPVVFAQAFDLPEEPVYVLERDHGEVPGIAAVAASSRPLPYLLEPVCHYCSL